MNVRILSELRGLGCELSNISAKSCIVGGGYSVEHQNTNKVILPCEVGDIICQPTYELREFEGSSGDMSANGEEVDVRVIGSQSDPPTHRDRYSGRKPCEPMNL